MSNIHKVFIIKICLLFITLPYLSLSQKIDNNTRKCPTIIDLLPKADRKLNEYSTTESKARFMFYGKYADTIKLDPDTKPYFNLSYKMYRDSLGLMRFYADSALKKSGLEVSIDPLKNLSIDLAPFPSNVYTFSEQGYKIDSIKTKQNQQKWLKQPRNLIQSMPVFITNNTNDTIFLDYQDLNAFIIQEAMDEDGNWKPIEYWQYSKCGNSYNATALLPHHLIIVKVNKYSGKFETTLRVKMLNGGKISYSNTFKGSINKEQFIPSIRSTNNYLNNPR